MGAGNFATYRRGFDGSDTAFVAEQLGRDVPVGAIARMTGRAQSDVQMVADTLRPRPVPAPEPEPASIIYALPPKTPPPEGTMAACVWWAAHKHGAAVADIMGRSPRRHVAWARQEAMWEAYQIRTEAGTRKFGRPRIGQYFGRDRQTVWHSIRAYEARLEAARQARAA